MPRKTHGSQPMCHWEQGGVNLTATGDFKESSTCMNQSQSSDVATLLSISCGTLVVQLHAVVNVLGGVRLYVTWHHVGRPNSMWGLADFCPLSATFSLQIESLFIGKILSFDSFVKYCHFFFFSFKINYMKKMFIYLFCFLKKLI